MIHFLEVLITNISSSIILSIALSVALLLSVKDSIFGVHPFSFNTIKVLWDLFLTGQHHPDIKRNSTEIIRSRGYPVETHKCQTSDGFILTLHRIPPRKHSQTQNQPNDTVASDQLQQPHPHHNNGNGHHEADHGSASFSSSSSSSSPSSSPSSSSHSPAPVVLIHHGLLQSSAVYLMKEENTSLPFFLSDAGFDVWLGNNRGTTYSSSNIHYTINDEKFWDFSFADMGEYDLPAEINHILNLTGQSQLIYIGHSQGTTQAFAGFSSNHKIAEKIKLFIAISPAAFVRAEKLLMKWLIKIHPIVVQFIFGKSQLLPIVNPIRALVRNVKFLSPFWAFLGLLMFEILLGWTDRNLDPARLPITFSHTPDSTSSKNLLHFFQMMVSGRFHAMDYGMKKNMARYGQPVPPNYDLSAIRCPLAVIYGAHDDLLDVDQLLREVPKPVYLHCYEDYKHMDFLWGMDAHLRFYPELVKLMNSHLQADK